jgi:hypothetical protein
MQARSKWDGVTRLLLAGLFFSYFSPSSTPTANQVKTTPGGIGRKAIKELQWHFWPQGNHL